MSVPAISLWRMLYEGAPCENLPTSANLNGAARTSVSASVNSSVGTFSPVKTVPKVGGGESARKYLWDAVFAGFEPPLCIIGWKCCCKRHAFLRICNKIDFAESSHSADKNHPI